MSVTGAGRALVERDDVLETFAPFVADAVDGSGRLVFLGGEAGVGKTALCAALADLAQDRLRVRRGGCDNLATPAPLGPLADAAPELAEFLDGSDGNRLRLFRRLRVLLAEAPTLLLIEDVHWADEATLDLLRFLGRRLADVPLLVVATFRSDEAVGTHPLAVVRGDLATAGGVRQVTLRPLSPDGVAALVAEAGSPLDPAAVHRSTGGNPFYVTELIAVGEQRLPATVRDAVLARASRLSTPAQDVLAAAAVLGARAGLSLLTAVAGRRGEVVDECVAGGMLVADGDALAFRHELARLAVAESLAPARRRALHAAALAAGEGAATVDDRRLVHHAEGCGDAEAILRHAPRAAARAARLGAHREASDLYRLALRFTDTGDAAHARLHEALAYECYLTDAHAEAHAARSAALAIWERLGDRGATGVSQRWLSRLSWFLGRNQDSERHAAAAVANLEPFGPSAELAMAYSNVAQLRMLANDAAGAVAAGEKAIELARAVGASEAEMHALNNVGTALWADADRPEGREMLNRSLELALAADAHEHVARAYTNLGSAGVGNHLYAEADGQLRAGVAYCEDRDLDAWWLYMTAWRARSAAEQGRYAEADQYVESVRRHPNAAVATRIAVEVVAAQLAIRRGADAAELLAEVRQLATPTGEQQRLVPVAVARAEAAWIAGAPDEVAAAVEDVWANAVAYPRRWVLGELVWWSALGGVARESPVPLAEPFALMLAGDAAAAARAWQELGCPLWQAIALAAADDPALARVGLDLADRIGAPAVRQALLRDRHARGQAVPRSPRATTRRNAFQLTTRELEVLTLLAEGLTNAEVADRLYLSEKTVGHHVSAVLRKTGEPTRARAVGAALRAGLVRPPT